MRRIQTSRIAGINRSFGRTAGSRKAAMVAAASLSIASAAMAQTQLYFDLNGATSGFTNKNGTSNVAGTGTWDSSTTSDWNTTSSGANTPGTWVQPSQTAGVNDFNIANFNGAAAMTAVLNGNIDVGGINFNATAGNTITGVGSLNLGANNVIIANLVSGAGQNILVPIIGSGTMTVEYKGTGAQGQDLNMLGDLTGFTGTLVIATDLSSPSGANYTQLAIGSSLGTGATIQLQAYAQLTTENASHDTYTGVYDQPAFTINAPILLNSTNLATSQEWIGAAFGGNFGSAYPSTNMQGIMTLAGVISGTTTDLNLGYGSNGGRGTVVLAANNTYTGNTYINLASNDGLVQMGIDNALPSTTILSFGPAAGNSASTSGVAPLDLNGHIMTIAGLATTSTYTNSASSSVSAAETSAIGNIYNTSSNPASIVIAGSTNTTYKGDIGDANINVNPFNSTYPYVNNTTANTNISLTINGPGVLTLAPQVFAPTTTVVNYMSDEYTGNTTVNGGGLTFGRVNYFGGNGTAPPAYYTLTGGGSVTVNSGATLSSSSTTYNGSSSTFVGGAQGQIILNSGSLFTPGGAGTAGVFTTQDITFNSGAAMTFDLVNGTTYDWMLVYDQLTLDSSGPNHTININVPSGDNVSPGTYTLIYTGNGISWDGTNGFALGTTPSNGDTFNLINTGSSLQVQVLAPALQWDPSGQGPTSSNGTINEMGGEWTDGTGADGAPATYFYNYANDSETQWSNSTTSQVIIGGDATQPGGQIYLGSNIVVNSLLTFGQIAPGANYSIVNINGNTYTLTLGGGITVSNNAATSTTPSAEIDVPVILSASQTWEVDNAQKLVITGALTENDSTPSYTLSKTGAGELDLDAASGSIGTLNVAGGAVVLGTMNSIGNASVILNGGALVFGSTGTFANTFNASATGGFGLGVTNNSTATVTQGVTSNGPMALISVGSTTGSLILNGNFTATSLTNETLATTTFNGTANFGTGAITNTTTGGRIYFNGNTSAGSMTISAGTTLLAAGATDNFTNGINMTAGTLVVGSASDVGVTATNLTGNAISITGSATLNLSGAGTIPNNISMGTNNQSGGTITGFSFTSPVTSSPITLSGVISGVGNLTLLGTDITLAGANTIGPSGGPGGAGGAMGIGNTGAEAGTPMVIHATNATSFGTSAIVINAAGATLDVETNVMANAIRGNALVTKTGPGTLILFGKTATGPGGNQLGYIVQNGAIELQSLYGLGGGQSTNTITSTSPTQGLVTLDPGTSLLADTNGTENLNTITLAGGTIARIADPANTADFNLSMYYVDSSGNTDSHNVSINVTASSTIDNQDQATAGNSRNLIINEPVNISTGSTLTMQSENTAGNYQQAAVVLRGSTLTIPAGGTVVDTGSGDVLLGDATTGESIVAQGTPGSDAVMLLGSHTFLNDGATTLTINGSSTAGLRIEAPMDATYTVPNSGGAPALRTYDGTTGLTGVNTTGTAAAGTTPSGYTTIGNGFTVLTPSRLEGLASSTGTLTVAATDANGATGLINTGPATPSNVALALDSGTGSGGTLTYQIDPGANGQSFGNFAGLTVERTYTTANVVAQLLGTTKVPSLMITGGAKVDITNQALVVDPAAGPAPTAQIAGYLTSAYDSGAWDLGGIGSSSVSSLKGTSIGYAENDLLPTPFTTFGGQSVDNNAVLVKYTWLGDLNLDGTVDSNDLSMMTSGNGTSWIQGDLNYDGKKNADDWSLFFLGEAAYNASGQTLTSAVPEPAAASLLIAGAGMLLRRRRR